MKVSVNLIQQYLGFKLPPVDKLVQKVGAQLGAVEEVVDLGAKYKGIVVAKVVSCEKHPNADKLHVCKIDDGGKVKKIKRDDNGYVQVVCGAPNVRKGLTVAWLPPGVTVPSSFDEDQFVLEAREIRGVKSYGMLASAHELAISDDHSGILEINPHDAKPGDDFAKAFGLDDYIIDIENKMFTHRPDCFGQIGVAREIAGIFGKPFKSPDWSSRIAKDPHKSATMKLTVKNELPKLVPRFMAQMIADVTVEPSDLKTQTLLKRLGIKPINNIVDVTNIDMLMTGQPLHAYDYDKVKALSGGQEAKIVIRYPKKTEKIKLLNGKEIEPRAEAIMIATDKQLIGVGGVMGGSEIEVDSNTKNIILECASFDMYSIRRTSMEHGLFTDAVTRFTKGQSPLQCPEVMAGAINSIIGEEPGGDPIGELIDDNHFPNHDWVHPPVSVTPGFINSRLGLKLSANQIKKLLENVEFKVTTSHPKLDLGSSKKSIPTSRDSTSDWISDQVGNDNIELTITAPFWRTDIEIPEDVVEEVGRLYGFDKLPQELPKRSITPAKKDELLELKSKIRATLAKVGANEVLTYSFVHGDLLGKVGQNSKNAFQISNALSPDLQYYRLSLTPSLLDRVHANIKAGFDEFAIFELGKAHIVGQNGDDGLPREDELTALVITAADKLKKSGAAYYQAKKYLETLIKTKLTYKPVPEAMQKFDITKPFDMNRSAFVYAGETFLGLIGEFRPAVARNLKLPKYTAGFELDTAALRTILGQGNKYTPLSRFPKVVQDITLKVSADLPFQKLFDLTVKEIAGAKPENTFASLEPLGVYQSDKDLRHKQVTLRLTIVSYEQTLTDAEVSKLLDALAAAAKEQFSATRI